jgi:hypothetical protein
MLRTIAVLLLLLGLATATPVVCLCAPSDVAGLSVPATTGASSAADTPSLIAASAAAVVASLVATAGGLPSMTPWQPPTQALIRWTPTLLSVPAGPAWSPAVPPPR